jgi:hypothetical protein
MTGAPLTGQALVASDEARSGLHPSGFDPSRLLLSKVADAVAADPDFAIEVLRAVERGHAAHRTCLRQKYTTKDAGFLAAVALATAKHRTKAVKDCLIPTIARAIHPTSASNCEREVLAEAIAMEAATAGETPKSGSTRSATARVRKDIALTPPPNRSQGDTP